MKPGRSISCDGLRHRPRNLHPARLHTLLDSVSARKNWQRKLARHEVFIFWDEVVGKEIAERAQPFLIRGRVLWVKVVEPVWMQQLHLQKMLLLDAINQRLAPEALTDIRFRLDTSLSPPEKPRPPSGPPKPDAAAERRFDEMLTALPDGEAKEALKRLWRKLHGR